MDRARLLPDRVLPSGVRLTAYSGSAADLPGDVLQGFIDRIEAGELTVPLGRTYRLDQIAEAHADMEANRMAGKLVVVL